MKLAKIHWFRFIGELMVFSGFCQIEVSPVKPSLNPMWDSKGDGLCTVVSAATGNFCCQTPSLVSAFVFHVSQP